MKPITVFTTTYNRAYILDRLYQSLCRQTCRDFEWLVVDDGSTDDTEMLVKSWMNEAVISIRYIKKENGGMHTGHNVAYENIHTELNVCIDSDDYMPDEAIEKLLNFWQLHRDEKYAGILGLDIYHDGSVVSNRTFPEHVKSGKYYELKGRYGLVGDIKFVYRTDVIKRYPPYPTFEGERFTPLNYKYLCIDQDFDLLFFNEPLCVVEYMPDGSTRNIVRQYVNNPNGFLHERKIRMVKAFTFKERFKNTIHYVAMSLLVGKKRIIANSPKVTLTILCYPMGWVFYQYLLEIENNKAFAASEGKLNKRRFVVELFLFFGKLVTRRIAAFFKKLIP